MKAYCCLDMWYANTGEHGTSDLSYRPLRYWRKDPDILMTSTLIMKSTGLRINGSIIDMLRKHTGDLTVGALVLAGVVLAMGMSTTEILTMAHWYIK